MSAWVEYDIEAGYDYLYVEVSKDGGATWTELEAIDGQSACAQKSWDLSSVAGSSALVRFRYQTDGGLHYKGPFIDDISITAGGANLLTADVESDDNGWTAKGFTRMTGSTTVQSSHFYIAENRVYSGSCGTPTAPTRTTTRAATRVEARPCPSTLAPRRSPFATRRDWATAGRSSTPPSASRRPMRSRSTRTVI